MLAVHVRVSGTCARCGSRTSLDAVDQGLACPGCGDAQLLGPGALAALLGDTLARADRLPSGTTTSESVLDGEGSISVSIRVDLPTCVGCEHAFSGLAGRMPIEPVTCPRCGRTPTLRARPETWSAPCFARVTHLLDEVTGTPASGATATTCTRCGAGLPLEPGQRLATCAYCDARVLVPDAHFRVAHAGARGFFLLVDATALSVERLEHVLAPEKVRGIATLEGHEVEVGDVVTKGRTVATLAIAREGRTISLRSPCAGTVAALGGVRGATVDGSPIVSLVPA